MLPVLLHIALLLLLAVPIIVNWMSGQPGHQATAAAWAVGLLFLAGLWLAHLVLSSALLVWRHRMAGLKLYTVVAMHACSAIIIVAVLCFAAWVLAGV